MANVAKYTSPIDPTIDPLKTVKSTYNLPNYLKTSMDP